jgi:hypothetical protein
MSMGGELKGAGNEGGMGRRGGGGGGRDGEEGGGVEEGGMGRKGGGGIHNLHSQHGHFMLCEFHLQVDLMCVTAASGGHCYVNHLPTLGKHCL